MYVCTYVTMYVYKTYVFMCVTLIVLIMVLRSPSVHMSLVCFKLCIHVCMYVWIDCVCGRIRPVVYIGALIKCT